MSLTVIIIAVLCIIGLLAMTLKAKKRQQDELYVVTANQKTNNVLNHKRPLQTFSFSVTNIDFSQRIKILTEIINGMREKDMFSSKPYMGLTNEDILTEEIRTYELSGEGFPNVYLLADRFNQYDTHAIIVFIEDAYGKRHGIGYVPARISKEIKDFMEKYTMTVTSNIIGGKYKDIDIDDHGRKIVKEYTSDYGVHIHVSFWNDLESSSN